MTEKTINPRLRSRLSKFLTLVLRHKPELIGIKLDSSSGWTDINIDEIAQRIAEKEGYSWVTSENIHELVDLDAKGRYQIQNNFIRATYGHSVDINLLDEPDELEGSEVMKRADSFHSQCIECHKESEAGPQECAGCHLL